MGLIDPTLKKNNSKLLLNLSLKLLDDSKNRGDDGTGLLVFRSGGYHIEKWLGTASNCPSQIDKLDIACSPQSILGHTRYATAGEILKVNIHPVKASYKDKNLFLVMNGEISFTERWRKESEKAGIKFDGSSTDTSNACGKILKTYLKTENLRTALQRFYREAFPFGGFTILGLLLDGKRSFFFYLREGMRPLFRTFFQGTFVFTSETKPITTNLDLPYGKIEPISPGRIGIYDFKKEKWDELDMNHMLSPLGSRGECPFEYAYFQEPNSIMHERSINSIREQFGKAAYKEHPCPPDAVVTAVPKSGISAARGYAEEALRSTPRIRLSEIIYRKIGNAVRSFILPTSEIAAKLKGKFEISPYDAKDAIVVNVDDSIVRGNVSAWISHLEKQAGAKEVRFISAWPPITGPCYAGIAIDYAQPLARKLDSFNLREFVRDHSALEKKLYEGYEHEEFGWIQFDHVGYVSSDAVIQILDRIIEGDFCTGCFTGDYNYLCPANLKNNTQNSCKEWVYEFIKRNEIRIPKLKK